MIVSIMGLPVDKYRPERNENLQARCPFGEEVPAQSQQLVAESLDDVLSLPVDEVWGLAVDEIGTVIDGSREKKHTCPFVLVVSGDFKSGLSAKVLNLRIP